MVLHMLDKWVVSAGGGWWLGGGCRWWWQWWLLVVALMVAVAVVVGEMNGITISFSIVDGVPMGIALGNSIGRSRMKRRRLRLRRRSGSEHLRRASLVVTHVSPTSSGNVRPNGLKEPDSAGGYDIGGVIRGLKRNSDVRLCGEVVDLVGGDGVDPAAEGRAIGEIGIVELHASLVSVVRVDVDMVNPLCVEVG
ncbi:hypothetical protein Dimus_014110 [Dionaea muscipula]